MSKTASLGLILGLLFSQPVLANGGGYFRGGVEGLGDILGFVPKETEKIRILDELLTVNLGPEAAEVEVRYLMRNETDQKVKVRFGFPVEESADQQFELPYKEIAKTLKYCRNYQIQASGKPVDIKWMVEPKPAQNKNFQGIAGWIVSEITFNPGEEKPVRISFTSQYPESYSSVSDTTFTANKLFKYRLSSAACWNGTIGRGRIVLKPNGIPASELKVLKPVNRFKKEGENWVWNFENLEPTLADDLEDRSGS